MIWRHLASNFLTLLIVVLIGVAIAVAWGRAQYVQPGPSAAAQCVTVPQGASLKAVSDQLVEQGVVSNGYILRTGADYTGKAGQMKFGSYLVPPQASMEQVIQTITAGGPSTCGLEVVFRVGVRADSVVMRDMNPETGKYEDRVTYDPATQDAPVAVTQAIDQPGARLRLAVAEGVTSWQIVEALKAASFMSGDIKTVPPEGSLAPDTYEVEKGADRGKLLAQMEASQAATLQKAWDARPFGLPYKTPEEALVMASIVEKETGIAAERRQVASVFVNRLEQGMKLQTDPTVIYGVTGGKQVLDRGLRKSELVKKTPFNTYVIAGLPPTPIANPGKAAIEAALNPDATEYLYFVADGSGGHAFATTLDEHNANVAKWRAIEAARGESTQSPVQGE